MNRRRNVQKPDAVQQQAQALLTGTADCQLLYQYHDCLERLHDALSQLGINQFAALTLIFTWVRIGELLVTLWAQAMAWAPSHVVLY